MAKDGVEAVRVVLYRREEGQPRELSQPCALCRWPETKLAQAVEAVPGGHAHILIQCVVPCLRGAAKMIRGQPGAIRSLGALATEELLALVEPIQRIHPAVERRELQLVVPRRSWVASRGTVQLVVVGVPFHAAIGRTLGGGGRRGEAGRRRVCSGRRGRHSRGVDRRRRRSHRPRRDWGWRRWPAQQMEGDAAGRREGHPVGESWRLGGRRCGRWRLVWRRVRRWRRLKQPRPSCL